MDIERIQNGCMIFDGIFNLIGTAWTNEQNKMQAKANRTWQENQTEDSQRYQTQERFSAQEYNTAEREAAQAWQAAQTEKLWNREDVLRNEANEREDTALARAVADAKTAGLSPLAVLSSGGAGTVASTSTGSAPMPSPAHSQGMSAPSTAQPASWTAQAPHMDLSSWIGAMTSQKNLDEISRHNKEQEAIEREKIASSEKIENDKLVSQSTQFQAQLAQTDDHFMKTYLQNASQFADQLAQNKEFHLDEMDYKQRQQAWVEIQQQNDQNITMAVDFAHSLGMKYYYYPESDPLKYEKAMKQLKSDIISGNRNVINDVEMYPDKYLQSTSVSSSTSQANSVSASGVPAETYTSNVSASATKSNSQGDAFSDTQSDRVIAEKIARKYGAVLAIPVRVRDMSDWTSNYKGKYK